MREEMQRVISELGQAAWYLAHAADCSSVVYATGDRSDVCTCGKPEAIRAITNAIRALQRSAPALTHGTRAGVTAEMVERAAWELHESGMRLGAYNTNRPHYIDAARRALTAALTARPTADAGASTEGRQDGGT